MSLTGSQIIAAATCDAEGEAFYALNPLTGERLQPAFFEASEAQVDAAVAAAERDFPDYRWLSLAARADFLNEIARQLSGAGEDIVARANLETGLPPARLEGELLRTLNQLQLFAASVREGSFLQPRIDSALPGRQPQPRPDLRMTQVPLGPVVVFGASNFPLAFSVAGGDTASALAAGCPVIVKGHPAHPGTCELVGRAIMAAVEICQLPKGVFSLLQGERQELGAGLVSRPEVQAVAFTGSQAAGRALYDVACSRPQPIPLFAEMGSINPVFLLPQALAAGGGELARRYADAVALGAGQFCTNPGVLFSLSSPELEVFIAETRSRMADVEPAVMLHRQIWQSYQRALSRLADQDAVELLCGGPLAADVQSGNKVVPALLKTMADRFLDTPFLGEEVFGPSSLVVVCESLEQMRHCATALAGQLTATVHAADAELPLAAELFRVLEGKAGRLILNGFPTGVEVCSAMVHGGPYPATTDGRWTSVGSEAIRRFLRPICLQNFSARLLPEELLD